MAARRNSSARALGMNDFGGIERHSLTGLAMLFFNHPEDQGKLGQCLFGGRHQCMTACKGRYLSHPTVGLVAIQHYLVVVEGHATSFYYSGQDWRVSREPRRTQSSGNLRQTRYPRLSRIGRITLFDLLDVQVRESDAA